MYGAKEVFPLDLVQGHPHIRIANEDIWFHHPFFAFSVYCRVLWAPGKFQKVMNHFFSQQLCKYVVIYLVDGQ